MSVLTPGQAQTVSVASRGHNLLITGQAGTGKSTVVEEIISNLNAVGLKVAVVCSSGIACTVYEPGKASTVHSHYGLGVADLPWKQLVERSTNNSVVVTRVSESDVLIWDEASMSSQRMLEIVNEIVKLYSPPSQRKWGQNQAIRRKTNYLGWGVSTASSRTRSYGAIHIS